MASPTSSRTARATRSARANRSRTDDLVREIDDATGGWSRRLTSRNFLLTSMVWLGFLVLVGGAVVVTRELPKVAEDRVMSATRVSRAPFTIVDQIATEKARESVEGTTPRVCVLVGSTLDEIRASLENLPLVVQAAKSVEELTPEIRAQFGLNEAALTALHGEMVDGKIVQGWNDRVQRLLDELARTPLLSDADFPEVTQGKFQVELRVDREPETPAAGGEVMIGERTAAVFVPTTSALQVGSPRLEKDLRALVAAAGFSGPLADVIASRLVNPVRATYAYDAAATGVRKAEASARVPATQLSFPAGEVVYKRGERLRTSDFQKLKALVVAEARSLAWWQVWSRRLAVFGLVAAATLALAGYTALFVPRVRRNPVRTLGVAGLLALVTVVGCWTSVTMPGLIAMTAVAPTVFATIIFAVAYQQRVALAYGALHGIIMCIALDLPTGNYAVVIAGVGVAVWQLREVRDRNALTRTGVAEALALGLGTFMASLIELPPTGPALRQSGLDALLAGVGGFLVSGVALFILPTLERAFGLVTGMTLIELRDPKQALLRQLQQRAPGTYNHSLTIASLGEASAEAIGADGLLTYVGALYHDIGKMNKPDYFVENQVPGFNRHDKLSPAMSLLVIVGHVKDGLELAREFGLPRPLHHFIESHHGTTLVEYFYHRARRQAEAAARVGGVEAEDHEEAEIPAEIEYRYPGPRPRTKEAAILMLCDAVESASRTMADPTPSRIDQLVRTIANKRLMDGQFDECDLTLRELNTIVETVSKTLASIYHGRIAYPAGGSAGTATIDASRTQPGLGPATRSGGGTTDGGAPAGPGNGAARASAAAGGTRGE